MKRRVEGRIFSVTMTEEELSLFSEFLETRNYSENKKSKKTDEELIRDTTSKRGYGRAFLHGGLLGGVGGTYMGIDEFNKALDEGEDLDTAIDTARGYAAGVGAVAGGGTQMITTRNIPSTLAGAAFGAAGGTLGLEKNISDRKRQVRELKADEASERFKKTYQKDYSKKEEAYLKQLRFEDPDKYLEEVEKYRSEKRRDGYLTATSFPLPLASAGSVAGVTKSTVDGIKSGAEFDEDALQGLFRGAAAGAGVGLAAGAALGGVKALKTAAKYSDSKNHKDRADVAREKELKKSSPDAYKKLKEEQKDTVAYMNGMISKRDFKRKHQHNPNTKI